jgi:hypothetical protein
MIRLIPKIFYSSMTDGLDLFVNGLAFALLHRDPTLAVVARDGARAYLVEDAEFAARDRPELTIETDAIDDLYREIATRNPGLLHPAATQVVLRPWGAREFAVRDKTDVCVIFRQW